MKTIAIIQARMGSTRLPGKVLEDIAGRSMLARVCRRVGRATTVDELLVATTVAPADRAVADECERLGVACFRGSEDDVLDRYRQAAQHHGAGVIVRVTADCPLIDPGVIDTVVHSFRATRPDYASNTLRRTWPRGLDCEVMSVEALDRADHEATEPYQRAHVTPYIHQHPERFRLHAVTCDEDLGALRWTVDTPEDLEFIRAVYDRLAGDERLCWRDVSRVLGAEPRVAELNRHVHQKQLVEG